MREKNASTAIVRLAVIIALVVATGIVAQAKQIHPDTVHARPVALKTQAHAQTRYLMVHYLPWYQADPTTNTWGWHWTMNHFQPGTEIDGKRQIASQFYPLIGPYDSGDPDVIEYHLLLMKFAGIDGAVLDWYGTDNYLDYGQNHRNAQKFAAMAARAHMHFAALYEDAVTMNRLVKDGKIPANQAIAHGQLTMEWLQDNWFQSPWYLKLDGRPVFLTFGVSGFYNTGDWNQIFSALSTPVEFFTESSPRPPAVGAYVWPAPFGGTDRSFQDFNSFYATAAKWPVYIAGAYPRFNDIYQQAGVGPSWGSIADNNGLTYEQTLSKALQSNAPIIQVATWNDWGEGTNIEPSVEYGYRDLVETQKLVKLYLKPNLPYTPDDLHLPLTLYKLRKSASLTPSAKTKLDDASTLLFQGKITKAKALLSQIQAAAN